jgi:hypothetical protein
MANSWQLYNARKQEYINTHPDCTQEQFEQFCKRLLEQLGL